MLDNKWITYLQQQKELKYTFLDIDKAELVERLLDNIGEHNAEVRDGLVYPNLAHLLFDNHFTESELAAYLHRLMGEEYLFFDLDNYIPYSVLTRSFSLLQLVILVAVHNRDNIISVRSIKSLYSRFLDYVNEETIYDGYDEQVGFIHTIAHSADMFHQLMKVEAFGEMEIKKMFNAILSKWKMDSYYFAHDEDERMVVALKAGLDRGVLDEAFVKRWIVSLSSFTKPESFPQRYYITNNIKNLLRSLYFAVLNEDKYQYIVDTIKTQLEAAVKLK